MPRPPAPIDTSPAGDPLPSCSGLRVLVVDDCPDAADAVADLLRRCGAEVLACHGGAAAVAALPGFRPDACLVDLTMPGVDGCEVARRVRAGAGGDRVLLIALTGLWDIDALGPAAEAGFDADFTKLADPGQLLGLLADHARRVRGG
jgi:CheY-like chemotaxis protein